MSLYINGKKVGLTFKAGESGTGGGEDTTYETFIAANPDYTGDKEQFLDDLINLRLYRLTITFKIEGFDDIVFTPFYGGFIEPPPLPDGIQGEWEGDLSGLDYVTENLTFTLIIDEEQEEQSELEFTLNDDGVSYRVAKGDIYYFTDELIIPETFRELPVTGISRNGFADLPFLSLVVIPETITLIDNLAFTSCNALKNIAFPNSVTSTGFFVFYQCRNLESVTLSENLTSINEGLFNQCIALKDVVIPEKVTSIANNAFRDCSALKDITIPKDVTSIGDYVFYNCTKLASVTVLAEVPPTIAGFTFSNNHSSRIIYVPDASVADYKAATNWNSYSASIRPLSEKED